SFFSISIRPMAVGVHSRRPSDASEAPVMTDKEPTGQEEDEGAKGANEQSVGAARHTPKKREGAFLSSARIVALESELKKTERTLLPKVWAAIGDVCRVHGWHSESSRNALESYAELDRQIGDLDRAENESEESDKDLQRTVASKAMAAAD